MVACAMLRNVESWNSMYGTCMLVNSLVSVKIVSRDFIAGLADEPSSECTSNGIHSTRFLGGEY